MKRFLILLSLLGLFPFIPSKENSARAHTQYMSVGMSVGNVSFFYSNMRPYGEWIEIESGFYAWRPLRVRYGWRPYLHGRWVWTDYGWYWMSYEPFGWATYHYGRWYYDDFYGWIWIPDTVWGPAWVEWRYNDDYIGWAPLPPYASFSISIGIRYTTRWVAPSSYWCFVRYRHFGANRIDGYVTDEGNTRRLIRTTRGSTRYEVDRDRIINRGIDRNIVERRGNLRIDRTEVGETRDIKERIVRDGTRERVEVYRPSRTDFERQDERIEARRPERKISLDLNRVDRSRRDEGMNRSTERDEKRPKIDRREDRRMPEQKNLERVPVPQKKDSYRPSERGNAEQRRESYERRTTPERRERSGEFRSSQPDRSSRRETPSVRPQPRRESTPSNPPSSRGRGERKKRD